MFYHAFSKLSLSKVLFFWIKNDFWLFFDLKSDFALKILLNKAIGVRNKKKIIESKILGIIWLRINASLNQIISIILENLFEKTPNADMTRLE